MKPIITVAKNLKLLFRSKESAYTIIFGPILIILLVSFAFLGAGDDLQINIGVHAVEYTDSVDSIVDTLNDKYFVSIFPDNRSCIGSVEQGNTNACMVFRTDEDVAFYLDFSRINLVYQILDDLSGEMDVQANAIRSQLASNAFLRLETAAQLINESMEQTEKLEATFANISVSIGMAEQAIDRIPNGTQNVTDLRMIRSYQQGLAQNTRIVSGEALTALESAVRMIRELEAECEECPDSIEEDIDIVLEDIDNAEELIYEISEDVMPRQLDEVTLILRYAIEDVERIESAIRNATIAGTTVHEGVSIAAEGIEEGRDSLGLVNTRLRYTRDFLMGEETDVEQIESPIDTDVVNIAVDESALSFAYPYLLVLVIMFIGLLLSSMLIVTDKTSRASFRNFTTPTSDAYHVFMAFLTSFFLLFAEILVILLLSTIFVAQPLLLNLWPTLLIISVSIIVFTFLGMIIGYLAKTQEAAMITSISIASVLLFVSNLVIPVEGMASIARALSAVNPYIVLSELLKRSMLYGVPMQRIGSELLIMIAFIGILVLFTLWVQRRIKQRFFKQAEQLLPVKRHTPKPLHLGYRRIHNEVELMEALDKMTRSEFSSVVKSDDNVIAEWIEMELRNKRLARKLRTENKEKMILRLDKYLRRHGKHIKDTSA